MKIEQYISEEGQRLTVLTPLETGETIYMTEVIMGNDRMQFPLPVKIEDATSIEDAFNKMPDAIEAVKKMVAEEQAKPKLITPSKLQTGSGQVAPSLKLVQ